MNKKKLIKSTVDFVKKELSGEATGHDWYHTYRVWRLAKKIQEKEGGDIFVIEMAALLHDLDDWKFSKGTKRTKNFLSSLKLDAKEENEIFYIIKNISYKGAQVKNKIKTLEGKIVQDADRLDALGAIGVARTIVYSGMKKRILHDPEIKPVMHKTFADYKKASNSTIFNHFYEKILLLKDRMNTRTGKKFAVKRHKFVKDYLKKFLKEWEGEI